MKKLFSTLYVSTQGAYISKERENIVVSLQSKELFRAPIHLINSVVCFGNIMCSPFLLGLCAENNASVSYFTEYGRFIAKVQSPVSGNVLLRKQQYKYSDDGKFCLETAQSVLLGKLNNSRTVINRALRDHEDKISDSDKLKQVSDGLRRAIANIFNAENVDVLRGMEGDAAVAYFSVFNKLILNHKEEFFMPGRNRRPPKDRVNCLLSFVYTLLVHDVSSALEGVGLDPQVGFLHKDRPGRPSLALDIMEEFRSVIADRLVLTLINLSQVNANGFSESPSGGVIMDDENRKIVIDAYRKRKEEEIFHPFFKENIHIGLLYHAQALLFARYIRGDIDAYPPFIWK
ncbi:CRISPR-associated endonuclease Cas1 1 [Endomicrobiia bacterium]|nr:CRISPR-associated endonuclease Cas1 1 [Endomicrobiia bacterium]GHT20162.1 CRISPR-associated endonuclease Cas1 1 [Endomicrobiia bacterium]GHT30393.1 CRISPR-associated endonuclease Cas1 1 [Endomicrobiia bacterium]